MALTHLVDTSALTRVGEPSVRGGLADASRSLARCSISDLELGFSARNGDDWDTIQAALVTFPEIVLEPHHLRRAKHVQRLLAEAGLRGRKIPDLLVAACAEDRGLAVLHYDHDFDHIADVTGQTVEWIVPAGSIS